MKLKFTKEMLKIQQETFRKFFGTMLTPDNACILYSLLKAPNYTTENISDARLVELAGLKTTEEVRHNLEQLREMAFAYSEQINMRKIYKLTECGISVARYLDSFLGMLVTFDLQKDKLPKKLREAYYEIFKQPKTREYLMVLYRKLKGIDERFQHGI